MRTLLVTIAVLGLFVLPLVAAEEVKIDLSGSRVAAGYQGDQGYTNPNSFTVPDAKVQANAKLAEDVSAVIRLNFDGGVANGADYMYIKVDDVIKKISGNKGPVDFTITAGRFKMDFGEETFGNNVVENALVNNSITNPSGNDVGIQLKQDNLADSLPLIIGASLGFFNGNGSAIADGNNAKAFCLKASGTMKTTPLYFSISTYGAKLQNDPRLLGVAQTAYDLAIDAGLTAAEAGAAAIGAATAYAAQNDITESALNIFDNNIGWGGVWTRKVVELDIRYDLLEGAQKFDPAKCPLYSDSKGVFRLAYCLKGSDSGEVVADRLNYAYVMLDGIYNVDKKWYVAFRYSYIQDKDNTTDKYTRISFGGGHRITDSTILKLDYTTNTEPSYDKVDNDSINLILSTKW